MSFFSVTLLAPIALLGLLGLAIPIYLHMRHKPRAEKYRFPALEFLMKAQRKRKRRFRVEQLLLMLFRIFIVCLLAFLFAKPYVDEHFGQLGGSGSQPLIVILDDSVSMLAQPQGKPLFDTARETVADLVDARTGGSAMLLLPASSPSSLLDRNTADALRNVEDTLVATTQRATLDQAYQVAMDQIEANAWQQATIRILTDGSLSAWDKLPTRKPEQVEVIYSALNNDTPIRNMGIVTVEQAPGDQGAVEVSVVNGGIRSQDVALQLESSQGDIDQTLRIDAFGRGTHRFGVSSPVPPTLDISIPTDDFPLDNRFTYVPRDMSTIRILVVDGDANPQAVRSESFFMKNALGADESSTYGYALDVISPSGFTRERMADAEVICLLNVDAPNPDLLGEALTQGKGLFISMGHLMDFERWNEFLQTRELEIWEPRQFTNPMPIEIKQFDHDFFRPIEEREWRNYLGDAGIEQIRLLSVGRSRFDIPLALPDGTPLLLSKDLNPGRMMIWTSSVDLAWTNFPLQVGYVPFIRQAMAYLANRESSTAHQSVTVSQAMAQGMDEFLAPKYIAPPFENLTINGLKPGVYTKTEGSKTQFVHVMLDPEEQNFRTFADLSQSAESQASLEKIGFRAYTRTDLGPQVQWILFALILVETLVAARVSLLWGGR